MAYKVIWASSFRERRRGLLALPPLAEGEALVIPGAFQVHTIGMNYPIDVVFCSSSWIVKHVSRALAPGRITRPVFARFAIELVAGGAESVARGDRLTLT